MPFNSAEDLVFRLCKGTFLSLWSYPNALNSAGRELCDILVVCDPHVVLVSVKEVRATENVEPLVEWERWARRAIEDSAKQLYGAERELGRMDRVLPASGGPGLALPPTESRLVHRLAVALGSGGEIPFAQGDLGKGFVHVLDDAAVETVLGELDTITDFVEYLAAKESLVLRTRAVVPGEENLLALYLSNDRTFPDGVDALVTGDDLWEELTRRPEWEARKEADRASYAWDRLIEWVTRDINLAAKTEPDLLQHQEQALRVLAREARFARRVLGSAQVEFLEQARARETRARIVPSPSGVTYVFLARDPETPRQERVAELQDRCLVARKLVAGAKTVVGVATETPGMSDYSSVDLVMLHVGDWTPQEEARCQALQKAGLFAKPRCTTAHEDEYPVSASGSANPGDARGDRNEHGSAP